MNSRILHLRPAAYALAGAALCLGPAARGDLNPASAVAVHVPIFENTPSQDAAPASKFIGFSYLLTSSNVLDCDPSLNAAELDSAPTPAPCAFEPPSHDVGVAHDIRLFGPHRTGESWQRFGAAASPSGPPVHLGPVVRVMPSGPGSARLFLLGAVTAGVWHMFRATSRRFDATAWFASGAIVSPFDVSNNAGGRTGPSGSQAYFGSGPQLSPLRVAFAQVETTGLRPGRHRRNGTLERAPPTP